MSCLRGVVASGGPVGLVVAVVLALLPAAAVGSSAVGSSAAEQMSPWPGPAGARTVDEQTYFGPDMSGLDFVAGDSPAGDRLWAVRNDGHLFRLALSGGKWRPDRADGWGSGRALAFADGRTPDAEALVVRGERVYVGTERDDTGVSRPSVLLYDVASPARTLVAQQEWNLSSFYPDIDPNMGIEALGLVPNDFLVAGGFVTHDGVFDPAEHPDQHGGGVFFVAPEAPWQRQWIDAFVLSQGGAAVRVARIPQPLTVVTELEFEQDTGSLWAHCDDFCDGESAVLRLGEDGRWAVAVRHSRVAGVPNLAFEGFAIAPHSRCVDGRKPVYFSNDSNNGGHALWQGAINCPDGVGAPPPEVDAPEPVPDPDPDPAPEQVTVAVGDRQVQAGRVARVRVRVGADQVTPTGRVRVQVQQRSRTARLVDGVATVPVGSFAKVGRRAVRVSHLGDEKTAPGAARASLRVVKARSTVRPVRRNVVVQRGNRARVAVNFRANGLWPTGRVRVKVGQRFVNAQVNKVQTNQAGRRVVVRTPPLRARGVRRVTVIYTGGVSTTRDRAVFHVRVR